MEESLLIIFIIILNLVYGLFKKKGKEGKSGQQESGQPLLSILRELAGVQRSDSTLQQSHSLRRKQGRERGKASKQESRPGPVPESAGKRRRVTGPAAPTARERETPVFQAREKRSREKISGLTISGSDLRKGIILSEILGPCMARRRGRRVRH